MNEDPDDNFDTLLRQHLSRELDPHVGHATRKLDAARQFERRPSALRIGLRWSAAAMVLIGLGATGAIVARQMLRPAPHHDLPIAIQPHNEVSDAIVTSWSETYDAGTVLVDPHTPARMLRCVQYEETKWKDQKTGEWQSKITTPKQDVILVDLVKQ